MSKKFKFVIVAALVATAYIVVKQLTTPQKEEKKAARAKAYSQSLN